MNDVILKNNINIEKLIYEVRGVQVMLDSDLARLYECSNGTKDINKAVKRNLERFPENFMFRLTDEEYNALRFQIGTSNIKVAEDIIHMFLQNKVLQCFLVYYIRKRQ